MIIYYAMTKFHLIFSLVHKQEYHNNDECILFLYDRMRDADSIITKINETGIFDKVYTVPEIELRHLNMSLSENSSEEDINNYLSGYISSIEKWLPIEISQDDTLYIANDHWALGVYCICKEINYNYYEDGVGMLSKPDYSYELVKRLNVTHAVMAQHIHAFGLNPYVISKYADLNNQSEGFYDEKAVHFSVKDKLNSFTDEQMKQLLYIFDAPHIHISDNATILLTEHFVNMKRLTTNEQIQMYSYMADIFSKNNTLYIKQHPNDVAIPYADIFNDAILLPRLFPSELLPYCFDGCFQLGIAACSTSIYGLKNILKTSVRFNTDIEKHYKKLIPYYVLGYIFKNYFDNSYIYAEGMFTDIWNPIVDLYEININIADEESSDIIITDICSENITFLSGTNQTFIGMDSAKFFETIKDINCNMTTYTFPVIIYANPNHDNSATNAFREYIWVSTRNKTIFDSLSKIKWRFDMKYSDMTIDVEAMSNDKDIQIKILEGLLDSTNRKINNYCSLNNEYKKQIDELTHTNELLMTKLENYTKRK